VEKRGGVPKRGGEGRKAIFPLPGGSIVEKGQGVYKAGGRGSGRREEKKCHLKVDKESRQVRSSGFGQKGGEVDRK